MHYTRRGSIEGGIYMLSYGRTDSRFAPSQWETALPTCNDICHWLCHWLWSSDTHLTTVSQEMRQPSITEISLKISCIKFHLKIPGANELILHCLQDGFVTYPGSKLIVPDLTTRNTLQWRHDECDGVSNHQPYQCLLNRLFGRRSKKTSKLHVTGLCAGNSPGTGEFPAQRASNAENVSIWWRHRSKHCRWSLLTVN